MMGENNLRSASKQNWDCNDTVQEINAGSFQRIADACELMASNYIKLQRDYEYMRTNRDYYRTRAENFERSIRGFKGVITKLKKSSQKVTT